MVNGVKMVKSMVKRVNWYASFEGLIQGLCSQVQIYLNRPYNLKGGLCAAD